jgi:hypothetical protein
MLEWIRLEPFWRSLDDAIAVLDGVVGRLCDR